MLGSACLGGKIRFPERFVLGQNFPSPIHQTPPKQPQKCQNFPVEPSQAQRSLPTLRGHPIVLPVFSLPKAARPVGLDWILFRGILFFIIFFSLSSNLSLLPQSYRKNVGVAVQFQVTGESSHFWGCCSGWNLLETTPNLQHLMPRDKISDPGQSWSQLRTNDKVEDKGIIK